MNFTKLLLMVFAVNIALLMTGLAQIPFVSLFEMITNPTFFATNTFFVKMTGVVAGATAVAVVVATVITRSEIFIFASLTGVFLTFTVPLVELFILVSEQSHVYLAWILVAPLILLYFMAALAWWRGRAV